MRDITHKPVTLRTARAAGVLFCTPETIARIRAGELPKGNLFDVARAAGFLGAKATPQLLPHCHPVTIDGMDIQFEILDGEGQAASPAAAGRTGIQITGEARSIGRTGIEMEILMAVSVAALELYDMLKPIDRTMEIGQIRLLEKRGGKSDRDRYMAIAPVCAVLVCSDSAAAGSREDRSGRLAWELLEAAGATVRHFRIVPDNMGSIQAQIREWVKEDIPFIFTSGGTGLGPRDITTEAVRALLERDAVGIAEAMRAYGQDRTPLSMMSRGVAGTIGDTLIVTLPGSTGGVRESLEAILPAVFHAREILKGGGHTT